LRGGFCTTLAATVLVGLHQAALSTPDLDRLVTFYRERFGFAVAFEAAGDEANEGFRRTHAASETRGRVVMLERGAARLELFAYEKPAPRPAPVPQANVEVCHGRDPDGDLFERIEWFDHDVEAAAVR
jgi:catechol 2,3-dioxygenase-like lactoylglutathione lyase family enzyme